MGMVKSNSFRRLTPRVKSVIPSPMPDDDLIQAAKAIHDGIKSSLQNQTKEAETRLVMQIGKTLETELSKRLPEIRAKCLADCENRIIEIQKSYEEALNQKMEALQKNYDALPVLLDRCEKDVAGLQKTYEAGLGQIKELLMALPVPNVVVPEQAFQIKMTPSPPRKTRTEKTIRYGAATGRPAKVVEETTEEELLEPAENLKEE